MTDPTKLQARIKALEHENAMLRSALGWVRAHAPYAHRDNILAVVEDALGPRAALKGEGE